MKKNNNAEEWVGYREQARAMLVPILEKMGYIVDYEQPHIQGERYLMSAQKLVLLGSREGKRVVIKASVTQSGMQEIEGEHKSREALQKIDFAYNVFLLPKELWYGTEGEWTISITEYIEQPNPFLARPLREEFALALKALKLLESVHATTYAHAKIIRNIFGFWGAATYARFFSQFRARVITCAPHLKDVHGNMARARQELEANREDIERYCGFLTHADFALQNVRITERDIYLIDLASLRFGSKHESWARFLNFMLLYNRPLENALVQYIKDNRSEEENRSLRLMRIYKLGELLAYHAYAYANSTGALRQLSEARLGFWNRILSSLLDNVVVEDAIIEEYKRVRETLRHEGEKTRQKELQQL